MARLSTEERGQAIGMLRAGRSQTTVSRILRCSRSSISRLWLKFQQTGKSFSAISFRPSLLCFFVLITFLCHIWPLPLSPPHRLTQRIFSISGHVKDRPRLPEAVWRLEPKIIDWEPNTFATDIDQRRGPLRQRLGTMVDLSVLRLLSIGWELMEHAHVALTLANSCCKDTDMPGYSGAEHMVGGRQVSGTRFCSLMSPGSL